MDISTFSLETAMYPVKYVSPISTETICPFSIIDLNSEKAIKFSCLGTNNTFKIPVMAMIMIIIAQKGILGPLPFPPLFESPGSEDNLKKS